MRGLATTVSATSAWRSTAATPASVATPAVGSGDFHRKHRRAVEHRVPDAGRSVGEVTHDTPRPIGELDDVSSVRRQPPWRRREPYRADAIAGRRAQRLAGDDSIGDEVAGAVEVGEDAFQRLDALDDAGRQTPERRSVENERERIDPPRPAVHAHLVDEMTGARRGEDPIGLRLPANQRRAVARQPLEQRMHRHATLRRR